MPEPVKRRPPSPAAYELPKVEISVRERAQAKAMSSQPPADEEGQEASRASIKEVTRILYQAERRRLPSERQAITHKFSIDEQEGFVTVGLYDDGTPGEIFIRLTQADVTIVGLLDAFAITMSLALQYGVPLDILIQKHAAAQFPPYGPTNNPSIPEAPSIIAYICQWLAIRFLSPEQQQASGIFAPTAISNEQLMLTARDTNGLDANGAESSIL